MDEKSIITLEYYKVLERLADFRQRRFERRRDETATVGAEKSGGIGQVAEGLRGGGRDHGEGLACVRASFGICARACQGTAFVLKPWPGWA